MINNKFKNYSWVTIAYSSLLLGTIASIAVLAAVPPVCRDALIHHLAVPKLYLKHGGIFEMPHFDFSYYPMNLDFLYLIPLYFNNDIIPKYIHFAFALLTAGLIYQYLKRRLNIQYALLGSLLFLSIPVIVRLSGMVYVDLGLIFFLFASMIALFKWIETDFQLRPLVISALFCGLGLGTKYNGLIGLFLLSLFIPFIYSRYRSEQKNHDVKALCHAALFVSVALFVFSPWMIRNLVWTGNPLYPLYRSVFQANQQQDDEISAQYLESPGQNLFCPMDTTETGPDTMSACTNISNTDDPRMNPFQIRKHIYGESGMEILLVPLRVFFQGRDDDSKYFDGRANPFLLLLPILAFFGIKSNSYQVKTEKLFFVFFSILFLLFVYAQSVMRIRYFAPILPPLVVLSMFGLNNLKLILTGPKIQMTDNLAQLVVAGVILAMLGINGLYISARFEHVQPFAYLSGKLTRDDYIQKYRPEYAAFQYANQNLKEDDTILAVYVGNRGYYADVDIRFSIDRLQKLAAIAETPEMIFLKLHKENITHLLINHELFNLYADQYNPHEKRMLEEFFKHHALRIFSQDGYVLYRLHQKTHG